jgi:hypothetical protein
MEQEQGARKAATDASGFQRSLNKLEEARAQALQNAGGDKQAEAQINAQYDTASNAVSGKMNEMASQYGLETSGTDMLERAQGKMTVTKQLKDEITAEKNPTKKAQLQRLLTGVESDMISPQDAIEATTTGSLGVGNRSVQRSVNYKDGSIQTVYTDGTTEITTAAGNTFGPDDDGYEEATTGARDSGVSYAGDEAAATQEGKQSALDRAEIAKEYVASSETEKTYLDARDVVEDMEDYSFGRVKSMFPNFSQGSLKLQNFKNEIGLKVIAGGNFGQLNETELKLALNQGIPDGLTKQETLDWIDRRIAAERQVQAAAVDYMRWSKENKGGTRSEYIVDREIDEGKENEPSGGAPNDGANLSESKGSDSTTITLPNGATATKVN